MSTLARWLLVLSLALTVHILYLVLGLLNLVLTYSGALHQARFDGIFPYGAVDFATAHGLALIELVLLAGLVIAFAIVLLRRHGEA